ncbi:hypothetical protein [Stackebrandtia nassauensis]|uniref:Uncharacterized protein n=1 Tax=Stackebrandtia nassauensis (strain DSM 44728 / CIP 108903 / NRRL B-16338 / NBRC 102104 / LLR-40K-21) TaxID=446470 RepID=D3PTZ9_STANL|nr:hypothetical protein [Stackebrandtia nassauensis]ADD39757.1 hypothetical protein Snas_0035 [Stackebrandtia nassauensis DSM 44728]
MASDFAAQIDAKLDEIVDAYLSRYAQISIKGIAAHAQAGGKGPGPTTRSVQADSDAMDQALLQMLELQRPVWRSWFMGLGEPGPEGANEAAQSMRTVFDSMDLNSENHPGHPVHRIQTNKMSGWKAAASTAFATYLGKLAHAMDNQRAIAEVIKGFPEVRGKLTDAAQEHALDIAEATIAALKQRAKEAAKERRQAFGEFIKGFAEIVGAVLTAPAGGVAVAAAAGAIKGMGGVISKQVENMGGTEPPQIIDSMEEALRKAKEGLNEDRAKLRASMMDVLSHRVNQPDNEDYLLRPPELGYLSPARTRRVRSEVAGSTTR